MSARVTVAVPILLLLSLALPACPKPPPVGPALPPPPGQPLERPFFWRVDPRADTTAEPTYILGTRHIGIDPFEVLPLGIWRKFDGATSLVMEVDLTGPETLGLGKLPEGQTLDTQMSAEDWARIVQALDLDRDEADAIKRLQPWMLVIQLTQTLTPSARTIEDVLHQRGKEQKKREVFLETISVQAGLLSRFIDIAYLLEFVSDLDKQKRALAQQARVYRSGDEKALYQSAIVNMEKHIGKDGMDALMYGRNRAWLPALERLVAEGDTFVMVGAAHLVGPGSVLDLLRQRGYTVTRLPE